MRRPWVYGKIAIASLVIASGAVGCSDPSSGGPAPGSGGHESSTTGGASGGHESSTTGGASGGHESSTTGGAVSTGGTTSVGGSGNTPGDCTIQGPTVCTEPAPTYADVEPIFASRCVVCHGQTPGHWPLASYGHVTHWRDTIRAALLTCTMPPAEAQMLLPDAESLLILHWIQCGMPP